MKVMIAAGGTGGHINPALALAEVLREKHPEAEIVFFGSRNRMEARLFPEKGYRFYGLEMSGTNGPLSAKIRSLRSLMKAEKDCGAILAEEKPDICVGFGNYITVPLIKKAHAMKIPTMISEQNSFAGKANKYLARYADAVAVAYEANARQMPFAKKKLRVLGNPQATLAARTVWHPEELESIGLDPRKPFVFFMMGSLGSATVSKVIDEACDLFHEDYQVLISAGKANDYFFTQNKTSRIKVVDYVDGRNMLKGCALAVTRAGATTLCEISAVGAAAVLIPSPYVPNNHQYVNAMELVNKGAAVIIEEKDLTPAKLADTVNGLMRDTQQLLAMREKALMGSDQNAAYEMIDWMEELIHHD